MLKKVILTVCLLAFCNTNAYASLPDFTVLVEEAAPAVVKICLLYTSPSPRDRG